MTHRFLRGGLFWNWHKPARREQPPEQVPQPIRVFVENPELLLARYADTGIGAEKLLVPYLDKWIRLTGAFEGIADALAGDAVHLSLILRNGRRIHMQFPGEARERLYGLQQGQQLTAACQVPHGYGEGVFALANCELLRVDFHAALAS